MTKQVYMDFVVPDNVSRKQRELMRCIKPMAWPAYNGPGANYIGVAVSEEKANSILTALVQAKVSIRVLMRIRAGEDETFLIKADPGDRDTCKDAGCDGTHISADCPECYNCKKKGHWTGACPTSEKRDHCFRCKEYGHLAFNCPKLGLCKQCGRGGHISTSAVCSDWKSDKRCVACGTTGHLKDVCQFSCEVCLKEGHSLTGHTQEGCREVLSCTTKCDKLGH